MINFKIIFRLLGLLLSITGLLMLTSIPFSIWFGSQDVEAILLSACITGTVGITTFLGFKSSKASSDSPLRKREGFMIVTLGWFVMSIFGSLPYLISGTIPSVTDAFFETISGFTTTGASILTDIESMPKGILFWRSMTQWIGGMGIIVMTIAILPILGIGGMELFLAEAPGPTSDKLHPRIKETAKRLWAIYVMLTAVLMLLLWVGGMTFYDAINHAFTTMATGGFSTKNASMAYYNIPHIQYIIIFFMFLAGTNYTLLYFGLKRKFSKLKTNDEFKAYLGLSLLVAITTSVVIYLNSDLSGEESFRDALFQTVSIITTTGFVSADYTSWSPVVTMVFFSLIFVGGSAGSTSGGIKIIRHIALAKNCLLEFRRVLHPRAIIPVKINEQIVPPSIVTNVMVFVLIYILIFIGGSLVMAGTGLDFDTSIGSVATALSNVGPGIGKVGPVDNFAFIPDVGKWFLSILMLIGRLELFTVLVIITPYFWKSN